MVTVIVALPLIGFLVAGLFGKEIGDRGSEVLTTVFLFLAAAFAWIVFFRYALGSEAEDVNVLGNWFTVGTLKVEWALRVDALTAVMLVVVCTVSSLVHLYSIGYMSEDPAKPRFFAYLSLFTFAMLMLVTADNLVQLFFGWEGVGLASYLLIGFWYTKPTANAAAIKAFVVNRVGDFGFLLGIFTVFMVTKSVSFDTIFAAAPGLAGKTAHVFGHDWPVMEVACFLLFMGAMGKSAQFMLHTWLPDAMEGPTPVSALIHAATMVTAGVFMVARLSPLFDAGAGRALVRHDHRRHDLLLRRDDRLRADRHQARRRLLDLLAARLHVRRPRRRRLRTRHLPPFHARVLQGAAVPVLRLGDHGDASRAGHAHMGALRSRIPRTYWTMVIGSLALVGFPFTAGWYSKDAIIEAAYASTTPGHVYAWLLATAAVGLTFVLLVPAAVHDLLRGSALGGCACARRQYRDHRRARPEGALRADQPARDGRRRSRHRRPSGRACRARRETRPDVHTEGHEFVPHESPNTMLIPLYVLSIGALFAGMIFAPHFHRRGSGIVLEGRDLLRAEQPHPRGHGEGAPRSS